ncbi:MAG TPA: lipopolysaccharide heptosyltransferase II [Bryobacteraceae bacterium]|nr:lipopolysaccharide heptosyltransferase II [Bryobacteraceae bacterium]
MKILVRATNWLGDAVMSLPALRAVRQAYPGAHIAVLARPWVAELYEREPFANEIIREAPGFRARLRAAAEVRSRGFDTAILLPNSFGSAVVARLGGVARRIGYDRDGRGWLLTDAIKPPLKGEIPPHESLYYLELLRRAGIISVLPEWQPIQLQGVSESRQRGEALLAQMAVSGPVFGVSPGAQNSRAKQWSPVRFAEAAARIAAARGWTAVLFGSLRERPLCSAICSALRRRGLPVLSLAGETTLRQFIDCAAACRVFLTNDSGAMHVASALCVPTVAVYGPTDWIATAPSGPIARVIREPVECSPCMLRDCPIDHRCMQRISAEAVAQAALELVK